MAFVLLCLTNCEKNEGDCDNVNQNEILIVSDSIANFVYSLTYNSENSRVSIGMTNTSTIEDILSTDYEWYLNGVYLGGGKNVTATKFENGHYTLVHKVIYKDVEYSCVKEFDISKLE